MSSNATLSTSQTLAASVASATSAAVGPLAPAQCLAVWGADLPLGSSGGCAMCTCHVPGARPHMLQATPPSNPPALHCQCCHVHLTLPPQHRLQVSSLTLLRRCPSPTRYSQLI